MTAPSLAGAPARDSVAPYTNYRIALASSILGGVGATLGWLICLAVETGDWKLVQSIVVGSVIGYVVHWGEHYVRAAIHESRGDPAAHHGTSHPLRALLWTAGGGFIALASEHLIAHMINEYLRPFLASLISLVPAGAIMGWTMNRGRKKDENLLQLLGDGLFIGGAISVVTGILWTIAFGTVPWFAFVAWWGLIGVGTHLITGTERNAVGIGDPIAAVGDGFRRDAAHQLAAADVELRQTWSVQADIADHQINGGRNSAVTGTPGPVLGRCRARIPGGGSEAKTRGAAQAKCARDVEAEPTRFDSGVDWPNAEPDGQHQERAGRHGERMVQPSEELDRHVRNPAFRNAFIRSWVVILLFALGAGLAPGVERLLRPIDYPNSVTYKRDIELSIFMVAVLALSCVIARFH